MTPQIANPCSGIVIKADPQYLCGTTPAHLDYTISSGVDSTCTVSAQWQLFLPTTLAFADSSHTYLQASQNPTAATTDSCRLVLTVVCGGDTCVFNNTKIIYINPSLNDSLSNPTFKACGTQTYTSGVGTTLFLISATLNGVAFYSAGPTYHYLYNSSSDTLHFSQDSLHPNQITLNWDDIGQPNTLDTLCFTISSANQECTKDTCVAIGRCCADTLTLNNVPAQACSLQTFSAPGWAHLKVVGLTLNGVTYTLNQNGTAWSIAGTSNTLPNTQATATANSVALNFAGFPQGEEGGTVCLQASDSTGQCTLDTCLVIGSCCPGTLMAGPNLQTWLNSLQSNPLYAPYVSYTSNTQTYEVTNLRFGINVPVAVNCNVTFTNCTILADGMGQFVVDPTKRFTFDSTQMRACSSPHRGISCTATAANLGFTNISILNHSRIQDARCGVTVSGGASLVVNQATFDRNLCHITIQNLSSGNYPASIKGSLFSCDTLMQADWNDQGPQPTRTNVAIYIISVNRAIIGNAYPGDFANNLYTNTIRNAQKGIYANRSGLEVNNNAFEGCNTGLYSSNAITTTTPLKWNYLGTQAGNRFSDCAVGIKLIGSMPSYVWNNRFYNDSILGIGIDQNKKFLSQIKQNRIYNSQVGIQVRNCSGNATRNIFNNYLEMGPEILPASKGISIENTVLGSQGSFLVSRDSITGYKVAIAMRGAYMGQVIQNTIYIPYLHPGDDFPHTGVLVENSAKTTIKANYIEASLDNNGSPCNWGCNGIRQALTNSGLVSCNHIYRPCDDVLFFSSSQGTTVQSNLFEEGFRGIYIGNANIGKQGNGQHAQDNQWAGTNFEAHIQTFVDNNQTPVVDSNAFYMRPNAAGTIYKPTGFLNLSNGPTPPILPSAGYAPPCSMVPPNNLANQYQELAAAASISTDADPTLVMSKEAFYKQLRDDTTQAMPPDVQQFMDSMALEDLGKIDAIKRDLQFPLDSLDYLLQLYRTFELNPQGNMEQLYKEVLEIALSDQWLYKEAFTEAQVNRLREIALMCPFEQGRAVYGARVLLTYVDLPFADYRNDCEQPGYTGGGKSRPGAQGTPQKNQALAPKPEKPMVEVFPNPNNGTFTVVLPNAKPARIELINAMGQVLHSANLKGRETLTPHLAPVLYLCRVWQENHVVHQSKLILQP